MKKRTMTIEIPQDETVEKDGLTLSEVAAKQGVHRKTIERAIKRNEIKVTRIGSSVRIQVEEYDRYRRGE